MMTLIITILINVFELMSSTYSLDIRPFSDNPLTFLRRLTMIKVKGFTELKGTLCREHK